MKDRLRRALPDIAAIVLLFLLPLLLFSPQTIEGKTMVPADNLYEWQPYRALRDEMGVGAPYNSLISDLVLENYAWKQFAREQILAGDIPLWQPYILSGSPFLAAGQSSMLYPFSLLFLIMPVTAAFGWFTVLQLWLAGLNMYILVRVLGVKRPAALVSAVAYQLSGFLVIRAVFPMILATACWLPLLLAMIELTLRQQPLLGGRPASLPWVSIGAGALGMAIFAGHVEALLFSLLVMGIYAAARLLAELIARWKEKGIWRHVLVRGGWLIALVVLGLALGAVQLIPSYELAQSSFRQEAAPLDEVLSYAYTPRRVLAFAMPDFFGNPTHHEYFDVFTWETVPVTTDAGGGRIGTTEWGKKNYVEGAAYMGILPMLLALVAILHWLWTRLRPKAHPDRFVGKEAANRPYRLIFVVLAVLCLGFIFGTPLYAIIYYLPFFGASHAPFRWAWALMLSVAVLAGFGTDLLLKRREDGGVKAVVRRITRGVSWLSLGVGAALILLLAIIRANYSAFEPTIQTIFVTMDKAVNAFPDNRAFYSYEAVNAARFAVLLLLSGGVMWLATLKHPLRLPGGAPLWVVLAVLLVAADLAEVSYDFYPAEDTALLEVEPPGIGWLQEHYDPLDPWRFAVYEEHGYNTMNANIGWLHGLEDVSGYDSLIPGQYVDYWLTINSQDDLWFNRIGPVYAHEFMALFSPMFDLTGVRYVITEVPLHEALADRYTLVHQAEALLIYEHNDAVPRAFTLSQGSTVYIDPEGSEDVLNSFAEAAGQYDVRFHVITEGPALPEQAPGYGHHAPVEIVSNTAQEMVINAAVDQPGWLIVTNSYYPGWRAWIREVGAPDDAEQEVDVHLVNGNFQGVQLPPGAWTVRLKFSPDSFRYGAFASFLTAMAVLFALGVWGWRFFYREDPESGEVQRVAKNTVTPIVLNLFNKGIAFVLTFAMLRVLGPAGAGDYRYAFTIYSWFEILSNFGLNTFLMREVARHKDEANKYLINTTMMRLGLTLAGIPILILFVLGRQALVAQPLSAETLWAIGLLYGGLFFSTISTGLTALFYAYEKAEFPAAIQTVSAFLTTTLGIGALLAGWGIIGLSGVSLVVNVITFAILGTLAVRHFFKPRWDFDWPLQKLALGESFPLMLNHLLATLFFKIDLVLLEALKGNVVVGWYGVVYTWVDAIMVIPSFFTMSLFPVMSRQAVENRERLKKTYQLSVKLMWLMAVPIAIMTTLLANFLIGVLGGPEFLPHGAIALQLFIWSILFGWINSVTQYVIIALNRQRTLTVIFAIVSVFNIAANLIFIPRYSYPAAAIIAILSEFALLGMFTVVIRKELSRVNWIKVLGRIALTGIATGAVTWLLAGVSQWLAFAAGTAVYGVGVLVLGVFNDEEKGQLSAVLPAPVRRVLMPRMAE